MQAENFKWIIHLSRAGVLPDSEGDASRRIVFSNVVFISLPVVYFIFMIVDYQSYLQSLDGLRFDQFVVPIVIGVCFLGIWLNRLSYTHVSRILFILLWPFLLHIIPIKLLETPSDYYFAFPIGIVFHSMLIQLMLSHRKERVLFWFFLSSNFILMLFASDVLIYFDAEASSLTEMLSNKYYALDGVLYWLLFNLVMFYVLEVIEMYIKRVNDSKALIENQSKELNLLNRNLGKMVSQRTKELEEQNKKLKNYAFYNAHLLRGPFCRVRGLIQIQELAIGTAEEMDNVKLKLRECIEELDMRIREIQGIVQSEGDV